MCSQLIVSHFWRVSMFFKFLKLFLELVLSGKMMLRNDVTINSTLFTH